MGPLAHQPHGAFRESSNFALVPNLQYTSIQHLFIRTSSKCTCSFMIERTTLEKGRPPGRNLAEQSIKNNPLTTCAEFAMNSILHGTCFIDISLQVAIRSNEAVQQSRRYRRICEKLFVAVQCSPSLIPGNIEY